MSLKKGGLAKHTRPTRPVVFDRSGRRFSSAWGGRKRPAGEGHLRAAAQRPNGPTGAHVSCGNSDTNIALCRTVQRRIRNHRLYNALFRNLIPRFHNLGIGTPCRGRWLSSNRNSSRNVVHRGGEKTQSAGPTPCRGRIFPAGGGDRAA